MQYTGENKYLPKEEMLEIVRSEKKFIIGIPREITFQETRVPLAPEAVQILTEHGHEVLIETKAGNNAHFEDHHYSEAGAKIVNNPQTIYKESDLILKVAPPTLEETELLKNKQIIFSALQISLQKEEYFRKLIQKKVTAVAYENIKDNDNTYPIVRSMSEIAGSTSILIAAEYLSNVNNGKGSILGGISGISPTEVLILGAGTVGEFAARAALGLGAVVKVFDNSIYKLRRLQYNLGTRVFTSIIQPKVLSKALKSADVVIGALAPKNGRTPCVVTEEMVKNMKPLSVIVDVSIDHGGCFETSRVTNHTEPVFRKYDIIHYCVPNIASRVSRTASYALSNIIWPIILKIDENGGLENMIKNEAGFRNGVYMFNGILTNRNIGEYFNIQYKDIDLLMAAF